jgi:hypothetical protein
LVLFLVLNLWVAGPYYALQHWVFFAVTPMPETAVDRLIPFSEGAAWLYLSLFLWVPVPPLLTVSRGDLSRYACGIAGIGLISNLIFLFFPTSAPRPVGATGDAAYGLVLAADTPMNACPSLHASLAVFTALWSERLWRHRAQAWGWRMAVWTWTLAVLYATLATKQHVLVDLVAGSMLATAVYAVLCMRGQRHPPALPWRAASGGTGFSANGPHQHGF